MTHLVGGLVYPHEKSTNGLDLQSLQPRMRSVSVRAALQVSFRQRLNLSRTLDLFRAIPLTPPPL